MTRGRTEIDAIELVEGLDQAQLNVLDGAPPQLGAVELIGPIPAGDPAQANPVHSGGRGKGALLPLQRVPEVSAIGNGAGGCGRGLESRRPALRLAPMPALSLGGRPRGQPSVAHSRRIGPKSLRGSLPHRELLVVRRHVGVLASSGAECATGAYLMAVGAGTGWDLGPPPPGPVISSSSLRRYPRHGPTARRIVLPGPPGGRLGGGRRRRPAGRGGGRSRGPAGRRFPRARPDRRAGHGSGPAASRGWRGSRSPCGSLATSMAVGGRPCTGSFDAARRRGQQPGGLQRGRAGLGATVPCRGGKAWPAAHCAFGPG